MRHHRNASTKGPETIMQQLRPRSVTLVGGHGVEQSCACASPHERQKHVAYVCLCACFDVRTVSHTHNPTWPTQDLRFQRNKNILVTTCYNQLGSVASKKPFGETSASGHHRRIPRSPSRRSTACLAKGGICMFCDASQTTRHWKGICSCFMPHNYLTKSSHSI